MLRAKKLLAALVGCAVGAVGAANGPMDWTPVNTNGAAAWRASHHAPKGVTVDAAARKVVFLAEASGLSVGDTVEFVVAGPLSDRSYETMLMSCADPADIASALEAAGVPRGATVDDAAVRLWPQGERLECALRPVGTEETLLLADVMTDRVDVAAAECPLARHVVYTGGTRLADGALAASTNIPCAVFAAYNHAPSALQFAASLDQSTAYGRFGVKRAFKAGDLVEVALTWDGERRTRDWTCRVSPKACAMVDAKGTEVFAGAFTDCAQFVREQCLQQRDVYLKLAFAPDTPVSFAAGCARFFAQFDGTVARLNGFADGQLYAKAFLPEPSWRNRKQRIAQPFEIYPAADGAHGRFVFVEEVWDLESESTEPELKPHEHEYRSGEELLKLVSATGRQGDKMFTAFIILPKDSTVAPALKTVAALRPRINCFYVFDGLEP